MKVLKGYRFRIYPDEEQLTFFKQTFGCVRFTYNQLLMARKGTANSEESMKLTPAALKKDYPFLKKTDSLALANAQRNLERAYANFFQGRAGYPKLKSKKNSWQSYTTNNQKHTIYFIDGKLKLPKLKSLVQVHQHREIKGMIRSATISAKNNEEFYVSLLCLEEVSFLPKTKKVIGISYCPQRLIQLSQSFDNLPNIEEQLLGDKLEKAQKKLQLRAKIAKKHKVRLRDAKNYQKQKQRVQKLIQEKACKKNDFIDQLTFLLVKEFDYIFVEKQPRITDSEEDNPFTSTDWYSFTQKLTYKTQWYGKEYLVVESPDDTIRSSRIIEVLGKQQLDL
jgi:putative transposase